MSHGPTEKPSWVEALGRIPSGIFVLTARHEANETGMLASWVQQCSFDPPQVVLAVNKERYVLDWLTSDAPFTLNILAEEQSHLLKHFARGFEPGQPAFEGLSVARGEDGPPRLLEAHAFLECRVVSRVDGGDHMLVIGRVLDGAVQHRARPFVHIRKQGLTY